LWRNLTVYDPFESNDLGEFKVRRAIEEIVDYVRREGMEMDATLCVIRVC
jgi:hypothetical protein